MVSKLIGIALGIWFLYEAQGMDQAQMIKSMYTTVNFIWLYLLFFQDDKK